MSDLVLKEYAGLPSEVSAGSWGATEGLTQNDLELPKIFHQQGLSEFVRQEKARLGDWCDSLTGEVLAKKSEPLEVIIFSSFKTMIIKKRDMMMKSNDKFEFVSSTRITPENAEELESKDYLEEIDGYEYKNSLTYNFCCLVPNKLHDLPYILSMGGKKSKAARKINTMLMRLAQLKRAGASIVFQLKSIEETNDKGSWYGIEVSQGRDSTAEELSIAYDWYKKSKSQSFVSESSESHDFDDEL